MKDCMSRVFVPKWFNNHSLFTLLCFLCFFQSNMLLQAQMNPICNPEKYAKCQEQYLKCKLFNGPALDKELTLCKCAKLYYGICLREAGCASDKMQMCVKENMEFGCEDISICGNNCAQSTSDGALSEDAIILPVNNFGANYLKFGYCNTTALDLDYLAKYSTIRVTKCVEGAFTYCNYWIPPKTYTALAIPSNAVFLQMWRCNYHLNDTGVYHNCPDSWYEFYGQPKRWPSTIDIEFSDAPQCYSDDDCVGSYCDFQQRPSICSPKVKEQMLGPASQFLDPPYMYGL